MIKELEKIVEEAEGWAANDGGLTMAASDILAQVRIAEQFVSANDRAGLIAWCGDWEGLWNCSTGLESDLVQACMTWASKEEGLQ